MINRRKPNRFLLGMSALFAACIVCSPAFGQQTTTTYGPFSVSCAPSGQLCNNSFSQSVTTGADLLVEYVAAPGHCSQVRARILVDGAEVAVTAFLNPGEGSGLFNVGPLASGNHVVALQGEGTVGGCNSGALAGWGGTMRVVTSAVASAGAAAPIPAVSPPLLWLLSAALLLTAGLAVRRRR